MVAHFSMASGANRGFDCLLVPLMPGGDPKTRRFISELRGEGTLPTLTLEQPSDFTPEGQPLVKFPRLLTGKKSSSTILLKNNGIIPASGRLDFSSHEVSLRSLRSLPTALNHNAQRDPCVFRFAWTFTNGELCDGTISCLSIAPRLMAEQRFAHVTSATLS